MQEANLQLYHNGKNWVLIIATHEGGESEMNITDAQSTELKMIGIPVWDAAQV